jgi:hypothetical protein
LRRRWMSSGGAGGAGVAHAALDEQGKVLDPCAPELVTPHEVEAVKLIIYTAVLCIWLEGKDRPTMGDVVANLKTAFALC